MLLLLGLLDDDCDGGRFDPLLLLVLSGFERRDPRLLLLGLSDMIKLVDDSGL